MATDNAGRDQTSGVGAYGSMQVGIPLFQQGDFVLNSGAKSSWKLECDALSDADWDGVAAMARVLVPQFSDVVGVPRGGLKLAERLRPFATPDSGPVLIVDDVLTTGGSMEKTYKEVLDKVWRPNTNPPHPRVVGLVLFARGQCPWWINAIFQMPEPFWLSSPSSRTGGRGA